MTWFFIEKTLNTPQRLLETNKYSKVVGYKINVKKNPLQLSVCHRRRGPLGLRNPHWPLSVLGFPLPHRLDHWQEGHWHRQDSTLTNPLLFRPQYFSLRPAGRPGRDHSHFLYFSANLLIWCSSLCISYLPWGLGLIESQLPMFLKCSPFFNAD